MTTLFTDNAFLPEGWTKNIRLQWDAKGDIQSIENDVSVRPGEPQATYVLPGMCNLHSHAFQRAMAGMTEIAGDSKDSFTRCLARSHVSLRAAHLAGTDAGDCRAIVCRMSAPWLHRGVRISLSHADPAGKMYANPAEMAQRLIAAAEQSGIGMSMLPVLYSYADFNATPLAR